MPPEIAYKFFFNFEIKNMLIIDEVYSSPSMHELNFLIDPDTVIDLYCFLN